MSVVFSTGLHTFVQVGFLSDGGEMYAIVFYLLDARNNSAAMCEIICSSVSIFLFGQELAGFNSEKFCQFCPQQLNSALIADESQTLHPRHFSHGLH